METIIATIVVISTLGIILYNLKGQISPLWVKLPAPAAVAVGYWLLFAHHSTNIYVLIVSIGMTIAFIGDTLLGIDLKKNMILGLLSFAIGYILFSGAAITFFHSDISPYTTALGLLFIAPTALIYRKLNLPSKILKTAIPLYFLLLIVLVSTATLLSWLAVAGAILLFTCDSIIGLNTFSRPIKGSDGWSLTAYNTGHLLYFIAVSGIIQNM